MSSKMTTMNTSEDAKISYMPTSPGGKKPSSATSNIYSSSLPFLKCHNQLFKFVTEIEKCEYQLYCSLHNLVSMGVLGNSLIPQGNKFEVLEFYGDSVLNERVTKYLVQTRSFLSPHLLTIHKTTCVQNATLAAVFDRLNLKQFIPASFTELLSVEKRKADIIEAIIGEISEQMSGNNLHHSMVALTSRVLDDLLAYICFTGEKIFFQSTVAVNNLASAPSPTVTTSIATSTSTSTTVTSAPPSKTLVNTVTGATVNTFNSSKFHGKKAKKEKRRTHHHSKYHHPPGAAATTVVSSGFDTSSVDNTKASKKVTFANQLTTTTEFNVASPTFVEKDVSSSGSDSEGTTRQNLSMRNTTYQPKQVSTSLATVFPASRSSRADNAMPNSSVSNPRSSSPLAAQNSSSSKRPAFIATNVLRRATSPKSTSSTAAPVTVPTILARPKSADFSPNPLLLTPSAFM